MSDLARVLPWSQDEAELVTELQGGSGDAFAWLVAHYSGPVYGLVVGIVSEPCDAADITQDVFLKAFKGIRGFRRGSTLKTWLYRIAIREALNHRRWLWRHHRDQASIDAVSGNGHAPMEIQDGQGTPFDQAASHEVQQAVQQALSGVPAVFRSAVILRDLEGMSYEEVAEVLEVSVGTVKSRILRGRRLLRVLLEPMLGHPHLARAVAKRGSSGKVPPAHGAEGRNRHSAIVHSSLFSTMEEGQASPQDTTGWGTEGGRGGPKGGL